MASPRPGRRNQLTPTNELAAPVADVPETRRYLGQTVRVWLGLPAGADVKPPALPDRLARLLLRTEEYESERRDR